MRAAIRSAYLELCSYYQREPHQPHLQHYAEGLQGLPADLLVEAFSRAEQQYRDFPLVADIRRTIRLEIELLESERWRAEWNELLCSLKRFGPKWQPKDGPLDLSDPRKPKVGALIHPPQVSKALERSVAMLDPDNTFRAGLRWLHENHPHFFSRGEWPYNSDPRNVEREIAQTVRNAWQALCWR